MIAPSLKSLLYFRFHRRQGDGGDDGCKTAFGVCAIAKGFVGALAAAAQANRRPSVEIELVAVGVIDFEVAFDA